MLPRASRRHACRAWSTSGQAGGIARGCDLPHSRARTTRLYSEPGAICAKEGIMDRIPLRLAAVALGLSLLAVPLATGPTALARDDDNQKAAPTPRPDPALFDAQVAGTVYRIFQNAGATV